MGDGSMLKCRLIARLDIKPPYLVKTVCLEGVRKVGDPIDFVRKYDAEGIDEILLLDIVGSLYRKNRLLELVERVGEFAFCPLTVGGGIRSVDDAKAVLRVGADKIAINTAAIERPALINELAHKFGNQCVTLQIDAKQKGEGWEAYCDGARQPTGRDAVEWASEGVARGCGEILLTSIDREGTGQGLDARLVRAVAANTGVPVVASGGARVSGHIVEAIEAGASAVAVAGLLHYNRATIREIKEAMVAGGIPTRVLAA